LVSLYLKIDSFLLNKDVIFDLMMAWKQHVFSRNLTLNFEFWIVIFSQAISMCYDSSMQQHDISLSRPQDHYSKDQTLSSKPNSIDCMRYSTFYYKIRSMVDTYYLPC
jgi:hypothetical protein